MTTSQEVQDRTTIWILVILLALNQSQTSEELVRTSTRLQSTLNAISSRTILPTLEVPTNQENYSNRHSEMPLLDTIWLTINQTTQLQKLAAVRVWELQIRKWHLLGQGKMQNQEWAACQQNTLSTVLSTSKISSAACEKTSMAKLSREAHKSVKATNSLACAKVLKTCSLKAEAWDLPKRTLRWPLPT